MSYLVLARKYRPQRFSELVGQNHVARTLTNAIEGDRVHHAFLFTGARGVGKTSAARILAKALSCTKGDGPTANPCGECEACQEIAGGRSLDVVEIDGASNTGVDDVRTLREGARYMPAKGRLKIYIIDEVHMLSTSAFNALLKTLEEPPPHVVFVFATTEAHKIPTTILSRCQRYDFKLIPTAELATHLTGILSAEKIAHDPKALLLVARQAAGSVRDGLSLLDQVIAYVGDGRLTAEVVSEVLGIADRSLLVDLARAVLAHDAGKTLRILAAASERGLDLGQLGRAFLALLRDIEVVARVAEPADLVDATPDELADLRSLADSAGRLPPVLFDRWARAVDESGKAPTPRLILEMAAVELCFAEPLEPLGDLLERLEGLESRLEGPGGRPPSGPGGRSSGPPATRPAPIVARPVAPVRTNGANVVADSAGTAAANGAGAAAANGARTTPASVTPLVPIPMPEAPPPPSDLEPSEAWRRTKVDFERRRPRIASLLASANVLEIDATKVVLGFSDQVDIENTERARAEIEAALNAQLGGPVRLFAKLTRGTDAVPVVRAETLDEADALQADRRRREKEAREHPLIQKAQDLFGAPIREIKI